MINALATFTDSFVGAKAIVTSVSSPGARVFAGDEVTEKADKDNVKSIPIKGICLLEMESPLLPLIRLRDSQSLSQKAVPSTDWERMA